MYRFIVGSTSLLKPDPGSVTGSPGAAMEEEDLKIELENLKDRCFGGLEIVPLIGTPDEIVCGEAGWGTPRWNHMPEVIAQTTEEPGLTMDVSNGPMWPISMPTVSSADHPAGGKP